MFLEQGLTNFPIKTESEQDAQPFIEATENSFRVDVQLPVSENLYQGDIWHSASLDNTCITGAISNGATTLSANVPLHYLRELSDIGIEENGVSAQEAMDLLLKYDRANIEILECPEQIQPVYNWISTPPEEGDAEILNTNAETIRENARIIKNILDADIKILNLITSGDYSAAYKTPHYICLVGYQIKKIPTDNPNEEATIMNVQVIDSNVGVIPLSVELLSFIIEKDTTYLLKKS